MDILENLAVTPLAVTGYLVKIPYVGAPRSSYVVHSLCPASLGRGQNYRRH